ncbi:MAG: selenocysteine-specific translation elongation factor [Helicobacter sp.]|nr:selenocysteine-specific translation elongation factor [Helicobacter sp.]
MQCVIVATAGHIDHGKTSLIKALNGFEGDSSAEEKRRAITIDLSFSNLYFPELDKNIAFVDVPGHHKFTKTMMTGAFACDVLLLVVSAKEGIMPQTLEHLRIAAFLGIQSVIVAITHKDIVNIERCEAVKAELQELIASLHLTWVDCVFTALDDAKSIQSLRAILATLAPKPPAIPLFRYYIDRSFEVVGAGCVVSGTVQGDCVRTKDQLMCCDTGALLSVKAITMHKSKVDSAPPSSRAALNLSAKLGELECGYILSKKGYLRGFKKIDVVLRVFDGMPKIAHNSMLSMVIGSKKTMARVLLLQEFALKNGIYEACATLETQKPIFAIFGEKFILKDGAFLAGGAVLNPIADPLGRAQKLVLLRALLAKDFAGAFAILVQAHKRGFGIISSLQRFGLQHEDALAILQTLPSVFVDSGALIAYPMTQIAHLQDIVCAIIAKNKNALLSQKSLCLRESWASEQLCAHVLAALVQSGKLRREKGLFLSTKSEVGDIAEYVKAQIFDALRAQGIAPLAPYNLYETLDIDRQSGDKALKALCAARKVVRLQGNLFVESVCLSGVLNRLREIIANEGFVDVALAKTHLGLSRKYAIAYLEYLDSFADIVNQNQRRMLATQGGER